MGFKSHGNGGVAYGIGYLCQSVSGARTYHKKIKELSRAYGFNLRYGGKHLIGAELFNFFFKILCPIEFTVVIESVKAHYGDNIVILGQFLQKLWDIRYELLSSHNQ